MEPVFDKEYEYDGYYNTRVNRRWSSASGPIIIGVVLIITGILSVIWSAVDIGAGSMGYPAGFNPNYKTLGVSPDENGNLAATWQENSIWPTLGKGIWVGLFTLATGILACVSKCDGSRISIIVFNLLAWVTLILSIYMMLSAIFSIQVYPYNKIGDRARPQTIEVAMNSLLIAMSGISFLVCLWGAIGSCISLDWCSNGVENPKYPQYMAGVN